MPPRDLTQNIVVYIILLTHLILSSGCSPRTSAIDGETLPHFPGVGRGGINAGGGGGGGGGPAIPQVDVATVTTATIVDVGSVGVGRQSGMPE